MRKTRSLIVGALTVASMAVAPVAQAANVHIVLEASHATHGGTKMLALEGQIHRLSGAGASCANSRTVILQRRKNKTSPWNKIGTATTNGSGEFSKHITDKQGHYRAKVNKKGTCTAAKSDVVKHFH